MSALPNGSALAAKLQSNKPRTRGFLHIVRHGAALNAFYIVTYHRLDKAGARPKAMLAEGAQALIDLLEKVGVDFRLREVRGALEDILRLGSANIPDLWLSDEELLEKGLVDI
ncbi:MAG TPA: hypothetical protein VEJ47_09040 [Candidatus Eremiobacteraceae bacterium]|nr:hypothetical protein [Candidatus Eremiobacteraceae bacterium]